MSTNEIRMDGESGLRLGHEGTGIPGLKDIQRSTSWKTEHITGQMKNADGWELPTESHQGGVHIEKPGKETTEGNSCADMRFHRKQASEWKKSGPGKKNGSKIMKS